MSEVKGMISNLAKTVTKTSGSLIKTTKISMSLASEESNLNSIYTDIGKKVHEIYTYGGSLGKVFDAKYKEILEAEERIKSLRSQLDLAKGTKTCPSCGKVSNKDSDFCPKCGKNINDVIPTAGLAAGAGAGAGAEAVMEASYASETPEIIEEPEYADIPLASNHNSILNPNPGTDIAPPPAVYKVCSVCNSKNDSKDRFCLSCGRVL